jgi:hypothetical protein
MNDMIQAPGREPARFPAMPRDLLSQVGTLRKGGTRFPGNGPDDPGLYISAPPPEFHPGAAAALAAVEMLCDDANEAVVAQWLLHLAACVEQPPTRAEMTVRIAAIREACRDIPAGAWSHEAFLEASQTFEWWPGTKKLHALLKPYADRITGTRDALRKIAGAPQPAPPPPPKPDPRSEPGAQDYVAEVVAKFVSERSFNQPSGSPEKPKVQPRHLSPRELLATWEKAKKDGWPGCDVRIAMLRKQLGDKAA